MGLHEAHVCIDAGRCVHACIETASCRACVDVCPQRAWRLEDDGLNLAESDCDGCGLCVAACPTHAIAGLAWTPARRCVGTQEVLMVGCEHALPEGGEGCLPCLQAIEPTVLLRHWQQGERIWLVTTGDCDACDRGRGERFSVRVDLLNGLLQARGRQQILLKRLPAEQWRRLRQLGKVDSGVVRESRRGFLGQLVQRPVPAMMGGIPSEEGAPDKLAPGEYLPGPGPMPWTVRIEAMDCVACHACIQVCPSGALRLEGAVQEARTRRAPCYRLEHARCTGCGLCVDVCQTGAIELHACTRPDQVMVLLHETVCPSCGVRYQVPAARMDETGTCWVCARGWPARRLYQVMVGQGADQGLP